MKTAEALYEAIEAVSDLVAAMTWDMRDPDITPMGMQWVVLNMHTVDEADKLLEGLRDSFNEFVEE
ncbi:hypothetical protein LCGC14_0763710 [marine sediment metagenome]|uniref:Uncharacterized protein n=1 Tax=marine sediment metagenome TaxID=412755 RepID=A0A0F9T7E9_9ZZZZ